MKHKESAYQTLLNPNINVYLQTDHLFFIFCETINTAPPISERLPLAFLNALIVYFAICFGKYDTRSFCLYSLTFTSAFFILEHPFIHIVCRLASRR